MSRARKVTRGHPAGIRREQAWVPMQRTERVPMTAAHRQALRAACASEEAFEALMEQHERSEMWGNDQYIAIVERHQTGEHAGVIAEISIRRTDRKAVHDWRHFQRIKNEIAGPEIEAVELYPAESRLMDTANQYYLYCFPPGVQMPMGYVGPRNVKSSAEAAAVSAVQRELPEDWR